MKATPRLAAATAPEAVLSPEVGDELAELEAIAADLSEHVLSEGSRRAYAKGWRSFEAFCTQHDLVALPAHPETVRWYVAWMSVQHGREGLPRFSTSTIRQHLAGVADRHLREGLLDPTRHRGVSALVRGLTNLRATRPVRKRPLLRDDVVRVITAMDHDSYPDGVSATRDTLAMWLGFAGALRRSEAAALRLSSIELHEIDGVHVRVGRSKADQGNELPDVVVLPFGEQPVTCAPCALHRWVSLMMIAEAGDGVTNRVAVMRHLFAYQLQTHCCGAEGSTQLIDHQTLKSSAPLLRATYRNRRSATISVEGVGGNALGEMLSTRVAEAGMDPTSYGFHSLRAGHVTQARRNGASTSEIMRAGRWQRAETVEVYDREYNPAARNSVTRLGL